MPIKSLEVFIVKILLKFTFSHSLFQREYSDSIVVKVTISDDNIGFGECAPRSYVSGSTLIDNYNFLKNIKLEQVSLISSIEDIKCFVSKLKLKNKQQPLSSIIGRSNNEFVYSAVIPFLKEEKYIYFLELASKMNIKYIKVKVGQTNDSKYLAIARKILGSDANIRVDVNCGWDLNAANKKVSEWGKYNIPVILDESFTDIESIEKILNIVDYEKVSFNIRISKCGGFLSAKNLTYMQ